MSQKEVYAFNVPTFGKGVVFDVDHTVRLEQFRFFAEALKKNKMRTYVGMMVQEAEVTSMLLFFVFGNDPCCRIVSQFHGSQDNKEETGVLEPLPRLVNLQSQVHKWSQ